MQLVSTMEEGEAVHLPDPAVRALLSALGGVVGMSLIGAVVGGAAFVALPLAGACLVAGAEALVLTVPALLLLQAWLGLRRPMEQTLEDVTAGLSEGGALLLALTPVALFFGMASPGLHMAVFASFLSLAAAFVVAVGVSAVRMSRAEGSLLGTLVAGLWAGTAVSVALPAGIYAFTDLMQMALGLVGVSP